MSFSSDSSYDSSHECHDSLPELLKLEKSKSPVWEYFGFPAEYLEKDKKRSEEKSTATFAERS